MKTIDVVRLILLASIWGGSFIFLKVTTPVLGAIITTNTRVLIAGIIIMIYYKIIDFNPEIKKYWKQYIIIGIINTAIPFTLFAYAALTIPASYEVILNSTAPLFGALFSWLWLSDEINTKKILGLLTAIVGVAIFVNINLSTMNNKFLLSIAACLLASACYGFAGVYIRKYAKHIKPIGIAGVSQLFVGLLLIPLSATQHISIENTYNFKIIGCMLGLTILCSAVAYLLYYKLIADIGPSRTLTVTFLMPIFGMCWGKIFLKETISFHMITGTIIILLGTWLVIQNKPDNDLFKNLSNSSKVKKQLIN